MLYSSNLPVLLHAEATVVKKKLTFYFCSLVSKVYIDFHESSLVLVVATLWTQTVVLPPSS